MNEERTWTGNSEVDAAIVMLDRIDCSPKNNSRIDAVETTLRRLYARNQELEARLQKLQSDYDAVGAGGVSAQRVTQGADHIAQDRKMAPVTVVLPEPVAAQIRNIKEERWRTIAIVLYDLFAGGEYERRYIYTEQQVRELLAAANGITQKKRSNDKEEQNDAKRTS